MVPFGLVFVDRQAMLMKPRVSFAQRSDGVLVPVVVSLSRLEKSIGFTFMVLPVTDPIVLMTSKSRTMLGMNYAATTLFNVRGRDSV